MKLLFLGLLYNREEEIKLLSESRAGLQNAPNTYEWNLIDGLEESLEEPVQVYSYLPVGTYPKYFKKLFLPTRKWSHGKGAEDLELGFINLPILKQVYRYYAMRKRVRSWCEKNRSNHPVILVYSLYLPYLKLLAEMKKEFCSLSVTIIVPDLPNAYGFKPSESFIKIGIKKYLEKLKYRYLKTADSYVLLTEAMAARLNIENKPYTVVEGICREEEAVVERLYEASKETETKGFLEASKETATKGFLEASIESVTEGFLEASNKTATEGNCDSNRNTVLMYSGTLDEHYGIDKLISVFRRINNPNYRLWLCGAGAYEPVVKKAAKEDSRITHFGYLTQEELHKRQAQATLLINPRTDEEEYTRYSFPSKLLDYMVSGRPVLCFKLKGIPKEYDDYLYYINENTVQEIEEAIVNTTSKSTKELDFFGLKARSFVLQHKNRRVQAEKILPLLHKPTQRVLQINITCGYGSTGRLALEIHRGLLEKGWESYIAYSVHDRKRADFFSHIRKTSLAESQRASNNSFQVKGSFPIESSFENYLRRGLNRYIGRKYIHSAPGTLRLIRNIKRLKPDLIQLHNIQQNSVHFPMLLRFLNKYGVPVVYTLHDCWAFTGGCYYFTSYQCNGFMSSCTTCRYDKTRDWDLCNQSAEAICREKSQALHGIKQLQIICVSEWLKSCAQQSVLKSLPISVIYNGIDTSIFRPIASDLRNRHGIEEEEFVILGAASVWDQRKRLDTFLEMAKVIGKSCRIVLIGLTQDKCPENIIAVPRTEDVTELARYYSCADVFFNASREETFGLTTAEAMACGTPVIVYDATACAEIVTESTGVVIHNDCLEELLEAIEAVKVKGKAAYQESCYEYVRTNLSKEIMLKNYLKLYEKMLTK